MAVARNGGGPRARPHQCKQTLYTSNSDPILVMSDLILLALSLLNVFLFVPLARMRFIVFKQR